MCGQRMWLGIERAELTESTFRWQARAARLVRAILLSLPTFHLQLRPWIQLHHISPCSIPFQPS